jgi:beta-RFAP synthase
MIEVITPCRLHFGLLAYSRDEARQFGGVGLMVRSPRIVVRVTPADRFTASGPMAERVLSFAHTFAGNWAAMRSTRVSTARSGKRRGAQRDDATAGDSLSPREPLAIQGAAIEVLEAPRSHTGLGTGTQLAMAVAHALGHLFTGDDDEDLGVNDLASLVGRGARSAIGAHGFFHGGLIIEGGKLHRDALSPMLVQQPFPPDWRLVLVTPDRLVGLNGDREKQAFAKMAPIPRDVTAQMCRLVLLGLLPAAIERDLGGFSKALYELQQRVGACFASAQGGVFADPLLERIVRFIREHGVEGVGQSSWGPTLYAVTGDEATARGLADHLRARFDLSEREVMITAADNQGCEVRTSL